MNEETENLITILRKSEKSIPTPVYGDYLVATLDILGYSDMMDTLNDEEIIELLSFLVNFFDKDNLNDFMNTQSTISNFVQKTDNIKFETRVFSDNILIFIPWSSDNKINEKNLAILLVKLAEIQAKFLVEMNILLRGAVTKGKFAWSKDVVFGKSLVTVYDLEKEAKMPRVIVDNQLLAFIQGTTDEQKNILGFALIKDVEYDIVFLNYLLGLFDKTPTSKCNLTMYANTKFITTKSPNMQNLYINYTMMSDIKSRLEIKSAEKNKGIEKIEWTINYFNECCTSLGYLDLIIKY